MHKLLIILMFFVSSLVYATVGTENTRDDYVGNGSAKIFSYTFKVYNKDELLVIVRDTSSNDQTTLTIDTDYTVADVGETAGGSITLVDASQDWVDAEGDLTTGYALTILRDKDLFQETDIRNQGSFLPETHEDQFDYLTMLIQQQQDEIDRSLKLPATEDPANWNTVISYPLTASYIVQIVSTGDGFETTEFNSITLNSLAPTSSVGDIIVHDGADNVAFGVGTNSYVLMADDEQPQGVRYAEIELVSISPLDEPGELLTYINGDTGVFSPSTGKKFLTVSSGEASGLAWVDLEIASLSPLETQGDMLYFDGTNNVSLPLGGSGQVLIASTDGIPSWEDTYVSPVSIAGDIFIQDESSEAALPVGGLNQILLVSGSGLPSWEDLPASATVVSVEGDMIFSDGVQDESLPIGTVSQVLIVSSNRPYWSVIDTAIGEQGDLLVYDDNEVALPVGTVSQVLIVSSDGIPSWEDPAAELLNEGDLLTFNSGEVALSVGGSSQILTVSSSGIPSWEDNNASTALAANGDILYYNGSDQALLIGGASQVLTVSSTGLPSWEDASGGGSAVRTVSKVYGDRDLADGDDILIISTDADDGGIPLLTIYTAAGNSGDIITIKNISLTNVSLAPQEGQLIDGETAQALGEYDAVTLTSDGENWYAF